MKRDGAGRGKGREESGGGRTGAGRCRSGQEGSRPKPEDECVCPKCGQKAPHERGMPCRLLHCVQCGSIMIRA